MTHFSTSVPLVQNQPVLDIISEQLQTGWIVRPLDELFDDLKARQEEETQEWYAHWCLNHPACGLMRQDPFTFRAFSKPRGYAGDAVTVDYIYGLGEADSAARKRRHSAAQSSSTWARVRPRAQYGTGAN